MTKVPLDDAPRHRRRRRRTAAATVLVLALGLVGFGGWQLWQRHLATSGTADVATSERPPSAADDLDERPVPLEKCRADDDHPSRISLGSLDVQGCVEPVGRVGQAMGAPANIHVAGWFDESALPGTSGLTIIDGHSSGRFKDGIFNRLGELERGAVLTVELGDGEVEHYAVTSVEQHPVGEAMPALYADAREQRSALALITCGGDYEASTHTYDDRVVVLAVSTGRSDARTRSGGRDEPARNESRSTPT
jgi:LPXTG-site transpeptidase (sortase) family protein